MNKSKILQKLEKLRGNIVFHSILWNWSRNKFFAKGLIYRSSYVLKVSDIIQNNYE